jgi:hypothetical protein
LAGGVASSEFGAERKFQVLNRSGSILQIVPRPPGGHDGVAEYALLLAKRLKADYRRETIFGVAFPTAVAVEVDFPILAPLDSIPEDQGRDQGWADIILHYVNYGYQERGLPFDLPPILRRLRRGCDGRFITIFHELYASAPPWRSAFWLQPWQKSLARNIARMSDFCIVSSETMRGMLQRLVPESLISIHPVISTLGEPALSSARFANRDPHEWVICGGTHLVERSLRSLISRMPAIPRPFFPRELFVVGGQDNASVRAELDKLAGIQSRYLPAIEVDAASGALSSATFGWIDYFQQANVPIGAILKSGSFAAYCAHGVIPVLPRAETPVAVQNDRLPGPYSIGRNENSLPFESELPKISREIYEWYQRNASSTQLAKGVTAALEISHSPETKV